MTTPDGTSRAREASEKPSREALDLATEWWHKTPLCEMSLTKLALAIDAHTAAKDSEIAALRAENRELISQFQRLQPAGSPPPLSGLELAKWIRSEVGKELLALRAQVEALKAARKAWYTTAKFRWKGTTGAAKDADARCRELGVTVE